MATAFAATLALTTAARAEPVSKPPTVISVADFDYFDTSGEQRNQNAEHETRLRNFMQSLRRDLEQSGVFKVVALTCGADPCSAKRVTPEELFDAARKAGARLLLYGGIHKMSTLVQWAQAQLIDIEKDVVLDDRHLSFRGDSDESWRRAEAFLVVKLAQNPLSP